MLIPIYEKTFQKELERDRKRGKDLKKLTIICKILIDEIPLPMKNKNHKLLGEYKGFWECHIEPDWLLVYKKTNTHVIFCRLGTHSDLF